MRQYYKWTDEQKTMLRDMFEAGVGVDEMARVLNRTAPNVRAKIYSMDLKLSDRTVDPDREEFSRVMEIYAGRTSDDA